MKPITLCVALLLVLCLAVSSMADTVDLASRLKTKLRAPAPVNPASAQSMSASPPVNSASATTSMSASNSASATTPVTMSSSSPAPAPASASASVPSSGSAQLDNRVTVDASPLYGSESSAASSSSSSCGQPSCTPVFTSTPCCGNGNSNSDTTVEDAVGPITQWLKDFKRRSGSNSDLMSAAKTVVQPLINKIRRNQDRAIEKLQQSNAAILQHIEEAATEHVYNLLRANKIKDDAHESSSEESSSYWSSESSHSSSSSSLSSSLSSSSSSSSSSASASSLSSAAAEKIYSELLKAAAHSESSESRSELQKIAQDIVKNGKF